MAIPSARVIERTVSGTPPLARSRHRYEFRWYFLIPALLVVAGVFVPLAYLLLRAFEADSSQLNALVFRARNLRLLGNTLLLAGGVLVVGSLVAFPLAWLTARSDIAGRRLFTLVGVLPLAVPGYVMAYVLLATTGLRGTLALLFDLNLPRLSGFSGALLAMSLTTYPYLFLNLRSALLDLDPSLEESARSLGCTEGQVFRRVVLPQLRPAFLSGSLLVGLHVLGDFGVVSLMRFETFSYALYLQYTAAYDRIYAAWLALMLIGVTVFLLVTEARLLHGRLYHRVGTGARRRPQPTRLGRWRLPAYVFAAATGVVSVILPVVTIAHWMTRRSIGGDLADLGAALWSSFSASAPAALLAATLALPLAYLGVRKPSPIARGLERIAYLGYATPPLAFALALIFFTLNAAPLLYQTLMLLIAAYTLHYLAEAIGPVRSALYQTSPRLQEAARALGWTPLRAFFKATFPLLRRGLVVSMAFVFLSAMKELPLTFLLSPIGFKTLAMGTWAFANEGLFGAAAPYALMTMLFSGAFTALLLANERRIGA